ncbi:hypothetical protein, partial [Rhodopirellula baltica]
MSRLSQAQFAPKLRFVAMLAMAAGLTLQSASIANAQGRGGRGGFPGGGGGGGAMFGGRGGGSTLGLLRAEKVREELGIDEQQTEALKKLEEQAREQSRPDFDFRNASEEDRREFFEKMQSQREEQEKETRMQLQTVLTLEQMERLDEIGIQAQGLMALSSPEVQEALTMTEDQKKKLTEIRSGMETKMREEMREIMQSRDREKMQTAMESMRENMEKEVMAVLTAEQKKKFEEMKGDPFDLEALRGGRGGERGARGGRGGEGGGERG